MSAAGRRAVAEGIGTFLLVFVGAGSAAVNAWSGGSVTHVGVALSFALVVVAVIYAIGHLSGAHINPAVTVAFWSAGRFPGREVMPYLTAQCLGGLTAGLVLLWLLGDVTAAATIPALDPVRSLAVETLLTFALMFVIMAVATDDRVAGGFAGLVVGLTVGFGALMGGPLTGASMNPARTLGPGAASGLWDSGWIYWVGPLAGAVAGAWCYELLRPGQAPTVVPRGIPLGTEGPLDRDR